MHSLHPDILPYAFLIFQFYSSYCLPSVECCLPVLFQRKPVQLISPILGPYFVIHRINYNYLTWGKSTHFQGCKYHRNLLYKAFIWLNRRSECLADSGLYQKLFICQCGALLRITKTHINPSHTKKLLVELYYGDSFVVLKVCF